jgi:hypothetical protein
MRKKRQEFMDLKQGGRYVHDHSKLFNHLVQYAPDQVDTDEKKKDRFMICLSTKLQERMTLNTGGTFPEFVINIIIVDDAIHARKETKKRKVVVAPSSSAPLKYRTVYHHGSTYPPRQPPQHQHQRQQQWAPHPPQRQHQRATPKALPPPLSVLRLPAPLTARAASGHTYFNCGCSGHFARECPVPKKNATQGHITRPSRAPQKVAIAKTGCVILFDSRASHDFISNACTQKYQLVIEYMHTPYMISTPVGKIFTRQVVVNPYLNLGGRVYKTCLVVLERQRIGVILRVN